MNYEHLEILFFVLLAVVICIAVFYFIVYLNEGIVIEEKNVTDADRREFSRQLLGLPEDYDKPPQPENTKSNNIIINAGRDY